MSNSLLTPTAVTREGLRILHQKLNFIGSIEKQYDDSFAKDGAKIGDTLKIRLPNQYVVRNGATLSTQDTSETSVSLQVATQIGVDLNFTSSDLTLSLDDFGKRILDPAMSVLAANIEGNAMAMRKDVYNTVANVGNAATYNKFLDARVKLQNALAPTGDRTANLNPLDMADVVKDTKSLFNAQDAVAKQYREGYMGRAAGLDFVENTLWPGYTVGSASSITCNTSTGITSGSNAVTVAVTGSFNQGDVITIGGVFEVHPETKLNTNRLQQFVVTSADGSTTAITVSPTPVTSGATQNVTIVSAGAGKTVTPVLTASATTGTSLIYHKEAFAFATADLVMPKGVDFSAREVLDGVSMRIVRQYDIVNDKFPCRLDVLYGFKTIRPQLACRVHNN
jgi:hypothetical protein